MGSSMMIIKRPSRRMIFGFDSIGLGAFLAEERIFNEESVAHFE